MAAIIPLLNPGLELKMKISSKIQLLAMLVCLSFSPTDIYAHGQLYSSRVSLLICIKLHICFQVRDVELILLLDKM